MAYAKNTEVPAERTRAEIENVVKRYGASGFASGWNPDKVIVSFQMNDRQIRFTLLIPDKNQDRFIKTPTGLRRSPIAATDAWNQEIRRLWRALLLSVKAKLETVESGISEFDQEFMAQIVMPDGKTVAERVLPWMNKALLEHKVPPMLPDYSQTN